MKKWSTHFNNLRKEVKARKVVSYPLFLNIMHLSRNTYVPCYVSQLQEEFKRHKDDRMYQITWKNTEAELNIIDEDMPGLTASANERKDYIKRWDEFVEGTWNERYPDNYKNGFSELKDVK